MDAPMALERSWIFESSATWEEFVRTFNRALVVRGWALKSGRLSTFVAVRGLASVVYRIDYAPQGFLAHARIKTLLGGAGSVEADLVWAGQSAQLTIQTTDAERTRRAASGHT